MKRRLGLRPAPRGTLDSNWLIGAILLMGLESLILIYLQLNYPDPDLHLGGYLYMRDQMLGVKGREGHALAPVLWINLLAVVLIWIRYRRGIADAGLRDFPQLAAPPLAAILFALLSYWISLFPLGFHPLAIQGILERNATGQYEFVLNPDRGRAHLENCGGWPFGDQE